MPPTLSATVVRKPNHDAISRVHVDLTMTDMKLCGPPKLGGKWRGTRPLDVVLWWSRAQLPRGSWVARQLAGGERHRCSITTFYRCPRSHSPPRSSWNSHVCGFKVGSSRVGNPRVRFTSFFTFLFFSQMQVVILLKILGSSTSLGSQLHSFKQLYCSSS
jgi:hypothetical protein